MKKDINIIKIDILCKNCSYRNKGAYNVPEEMNIVCCGNCGKIIYSPEKINKESEEQIEICVKQTIEEENLRRQ
jgi:NMD protein affecting ribosome stability and mRNA decay